ncbi:hypothetical protein KEM52_005311 [Ascosphaera acerosa]|nr:hypothetical protein KEM52_005311 [Ascosphaera acerosa]
MPPLVEFSDEEEEERFLASEAGDLFEGEEEEQREEEEQDGDDEERGLRTPLRGGVRGSRGPITLPIRPSPTAAVVGSSRVARDGGAARPAPAASGAPAPSRGGSSRSRDAAERGGVGGARAPFREYFSDKGKAPERPQQQQQH